jgi:diadenosine tetraphosphate (Ap4A) HIT family hydrolase
MMKDFVLHETLKQDLIFLGESQLSTLMAYPSTSTPWLVLIPRVAGINDIFELELKDFYQLQKEIYFYSKYLKNTLNGEKVNICIIGNKVSQLHIHIILRYSHDAFWPEISIGKKHLFIESVFQEYKLNFFKIHTRVQEEILAGAERLELPTY